MTASRTTRPRPGKTALAIGLAAFALTLAAPAQAQFGRGPFGYEPDFIMPPRAVAWRLSERGFTEIERPRFDGRAYVVEASNPYGDRVRLFVDPRDGAILGRQRLGAPIAPPPRLVARPAAPGYGYTEDEAEPRRPVRQAERLLPPGDIPGAGLARQPRPDSYPRPEIYPGREGSARAEPADRNPMGLNPDSRNPDAKSRPEPQRKAARLSPPAKPAAPRAAPEAPRPDNAAKPESAPKPEPAEAALEAPKAASPPTPASVQPPPSEKPAGETQAQGWTNPPADAKRPVRVIGGATIVPGAGDKAAPAN